MNKRMNNWFLNGETMGTTDICAKLYALGYNRYQVAGAMGAAIRYGFLTLMSRGYSNSEKKIRSIYTR